MPIRAMIFDLGGVLVQQSDRTTQRHWEERLGLEDDIQGNVEAVQAIGLAGICGENTEQPLVEIARLLTI